MHMPPNPADDARPTCAIWAPSPHRLLSPRRQPEALNEVRSYAANTEIAYFKR